MRRWRRGQPVATLQRALLNATKRAVQSLIKLPTQHIASRKVDDSTQPSIPGHLGATMR